MCRARVLVALLMASVTLPAGAGPWLREEGTVFLSFGQNLALSSGARLPVHYDPFVYAEWGVSERLTLSFNLFTGDAGNELAAETFVVAPLDLPPRFGVASVSLGFAGQKVGDDDPHMLMGGGVAWGKGFDHGWIAVETRVLGRMDRWDLQGKFDVTWGHHFSDDWSGMVQLFAGHGHANDTYAKLGTTAIWRATDRVRVTMGITQGLTGDKGTGLTLGGWVEF